MPGKKKKNKRPPCHAKDVKLNVVMDFALNFPTSFSCNKCHRSPDDQTQRAPAFRRNHYRPNEHVLECHRETTHCVIVSAKTQVVKEFIHNFPWQEDDEDDEEVEYCEWTRMMYDPSDPLSSLPRTNYNIHRLMVWDHFSWFYGKASLLSNPRTLERVRIEQPRLYLELVWELVSRFPERMRHVTMFPDEELKRLWKQCGDWWNDDEEDAEDQQFACLKTPENPYALSSAPFDWLRDMIRRKRLQQ